MCLGKAVDKLPGAKSQPFRNSKLGSWIPTLGESVDPHYFRTSENAEKRHKALGVHKEEPPPPPPTPDRPQGAKAPDTTPLRRRNGAGGATLPGGSTMLTGPSGVSNAQLNLGASSLLGGP
jgi:hypothetical protein